MPEQINQNPTKESPPDSDQAEKVELQKKLAEQIEKTQLEMVALFDELEKQQKSPQTKLLEDEEKFEDAKKIYGSERIEVFKQAIRDLKYSDREEFVEKMVALVTPFLRDRLVDPEVRKRTDEIERTQRGELLKTGKLEVLIHHSKQEFSFSDDTRVKPNDLMLSINWPEEGEGPKGIKDTIHSFQEIAKILRERPEIIAVEATSWMMSRGITDRLGFEKFPKIKFNEGQVAKILSMAITGRKDKDYTKEVTAEDIKIGAMSRDQFIERYD